MTQQQLIHEFRKYPRTVKLIILRKLLKAFEDDLKEESINALVQKDGNLTIEERRAIVKSLAGSIKMKNPPMTKEEVREEYYGHLAEKYK